MREPSLPRSVVVFGVVVLVLGVVYALYPWPHNRAQKFSETFNEHRTYRVEFYGPSRWQRVFNPRMYLPGSVRLVDNCEPARLTRQGPLVDFHGGSNARVYWNEATEGVVLVGYDTRFENVPPISPDCKVLPIPGR